MSISFISGLVIIVAVIFLALSTIPMENKIEGNTLIVKYIIGKEKIDITDAKFLPVPEDTTQHLIRIGGTSIGRKKSGNFMNTRTRTRYKFYLTGKGEKVYFEVGGKKYLVDGITAR